MDKIRVDFTLSTAQPVSRSRIGTLREYLSIVARNVGLDITKVDQKGEPNG